MGRGIINIENQYEFHLVVNVVRNKKTKQRVTVLEVTGCGTTFAWAVKKDILSESWVMAERQLCLDAE